MINQSLIIFLISAPLIVYYSFKYKERILFKFHNNFFEISQSFNNLYENDPELERVYKKTLNFMRDLEIVNFGLKM